MAAIKCSFPGPMLAQIEEVGEMLGGVTVPYTVRYLVQAGLMACQSPLAAYRSGRATDRMIGALPGLLVDGDTSPGPSSTRASVSLVRQER